MLEYLQYQGPGPQDSGGPRPSPGRLLFRGSHVEKLDRRALRRRAGPARASRDCCSSDYNVLILDEPGNHLDVDTVEALVDALKEYQGTVIFTSHDRHFTGQVATSVVEVRDGGVSLYSGKFEDYLYRVNKEIEAGEREAAAGRVKLPPEVARATAPTRAGQRTEEMVRDEMKTLEGTIARFHEKRDALEARLNEPAEADELQRLCDELTEITEQLDAAEERWLRCQTELDGSA